MAARKFGSALRVACIVGLAASGKARDINLPPETAAGPVAGRSFDGNLVGIGPNSFWGRDGCVLLVAQRVLQPLMLVNAFGLVAERDVFTL